VPIRLRAAFDEGKADEAALYAAWWLLAAIALLARGRHAGAQDCRQTV
jgi:hypothetical protein